VKDSLYSINFHEQYFSNLKKLSGMVELIFFIKYSPTCGDVGCWTYEISAEATKPCHSSQLCMNADVLDVQLVTQKNLRFWCSVKIIVDTLKGIIPVIVLFSHKPAAVAESDLGGKIPNISVATVK